MSKKQVKAPADKAAAIYIRVSTAGQADSISLDRQERECRALAKHDGFKGRRRPGTAPAV
jgi:DNA invertase Pin-like site-specific DNA recombinase